MKARKYNHPKRKAELSIQFLKGALSWEMHVTCNAEKLFSPCDDFEFGNQLAQSDLLDLNELKFLRNIFDVAISKKT